MNEIRLALEKHFETHRIVFWYDDRRELRDQYESLELPGVEKAEITNNQFGLKYRILRQYPDRKFLLYHCGPCPPDREDWLLDVRLSHFRFRTGQDQLFLSQLGLDPSFSPLIENHKEFFQSAKRRAALADILEPRERMSTVPFKMLAVCASASPRLDEIVESLLAETAGALAEKTGKTGRMELIRRCRLDTVLWQHMDHTFGYRSAEPEIEDFAASLFKYCFYAALPARDREPGVEDLFHEDQPKGTGAKENVKVFFKRWKDGKRHAEAFETLSRGFARELRVRTRLETMDYDKLGDLDYFEDIDDYILEHLVSGVASRTVDHRRCLEIAEERRHSHWHHRRRDVFRAVVLASEFFHSLSSAQLDAGTPERRVQRYVGGWYRFDQLYRNYIYHASLPGFPGLLDKLTGAVENHYTVNFLQPVNRAAPQPPGEAAVWDIPGVPRQRDFFMQHVTPFLTRDKKVCVVISDGLRYEAGEELYRRLAVEDRFDAKLDHMLSVLPSMTALGMAALLPHKKLGIVKGKDIDVLADGKPTRGTAARGKILDAALGEIFNGSAAALTAPDFLGLNSEESRALARRHKVLYIYHDRIDMTGDKRGTEEETCRAARRAVDELVDMVKKLSAAKVNHIIITADHGFLYQHRPIPDTQFTDIDIAARGGIYRDRRFVLAEGLEPHTSLHTWDSAALGLSGDPLGVGVPKSINRLRLKGSGSRYVHGGSSLQETVLPVINVSRKRMAGAEPVDVEIFGGSSNVITTGHFIVKLYQVRPVGGSVLSRRLTAALYSEDGQLLSDKHALVFDSVSPDAVERERAVRFLLNNTADRFNHKPVVLSLREAVGKTSHEKEYKSAIYKLRQTFTLDFQTPEWG